MAEKHGRLDVLVNNAGITRDGLLLRMDDADWDLVLKVNLTSAFFGTRAAAKHMIRQRSGSIINMASYSGLEGNRGQANYAASKAGLLGLTKTTAKELASKNVRCNAVAPGFIQTEMTDVLPQQAKDMALEQIPLKRFGTACRRGQGGGVPGLGCLQLHHRAVPQRRRRDAHVERGFAGQRMLLHGAGGQAIVPRPERGRLGLGQTIKPSQGGQKSA